MALLPSLFQANTGRYFLSLQGALRRGFGPRVETHDTRRLQMGHSRTTWKVQEPWKAQADCAIECEHSCKTIKGWGGEGGMRVPDIFNAVPNHCAFAWA